MDCDMSHHNAILPLGAACLLAKTLSNLSEGPFPSLSMCHLNLLFLTDLLGKSLFPLCPGKGGRESQSRKDLQPSAGVQHLPKP